MIDQRLFTVALMIWSGLAAAVFIVLFFISVPYGKINRQGKGWGPRLPGSLAWFAMELVSLAGIVFFFLTGNNHGLPYFIFFSLWAGHYVYRALIFPMLRRGSTADMPLTVMLASVGFNLGNTFFNGYSLFHGGAALSAGWVFDVRFLLGTALFIGGFILNVHSDHVLRGLRGRGDRSYKIPYGGFYRFVSCPNYLGEILEWIGWAVLTWSLAGASFALWTIANLAPRALSYHGWYKKTFPEYPPKRRALIPFLF